VNGTAPAANGVEFFKFFAGLSRFLKSITQNLLRRLSYTKSIAISCYLAIELWSNFVGILTGN